MKKPPDSLLNFALALLSAVLLVLSFPNPALENTGLPWLAPLALTPLLIALSREARPLWRFLLGEFAGIVYWFGVCYWIQFVLEYHGGMGRWGGWATFLLFAVAKAIHLGVFSLLAAVLIRTPYAIPAIAALWTGIERTHANFGFAWLALGNSAIDMPLPLRLAPIVGVYGISFVFALTAATIAVLIVQRNRRQLYWIAVIPALLLLPDLPAPSTGTETAVAVQPNMSEDMEWTVDSAAREREHLVSISRAAAERFGAQLIVWPEVPGPLYYYQDYTFREAAARLARDTHAFFLFGTVGQTPHGAPLNSAVMLQTRWRSRRSLRQDQPGPVRRIYPPVLRLRESHHQRSGRLCTRHPNRRFPLGWAQPGHVHLLRIGVSRRGSRVRKTRRAIAGECFKRRLLRKKRGAGAAPGHRKNARSRESTLGTESDERRNHSRDRSGRPSDRAMADVPGSSPPNGFLLRHRHDAIHKIRRLVRLGLLPASRHSINLVPTPPLHPA